MKVLVAGATGALGAPTVRTLVERGHEVYGLTRSRDKAHRIEGLGATSVLGDVLDKSAVENVVSGVAPEGVVQLLNALPKRGPIRPSELDATNELRQIGTRHLLSAALAVGARRYVVESMIFGYGYGDSGAEPLSEDAPFGRPVAFEQMNPALNALGDMERQIFQAAQQGPMDGISLRFGLFYGPGVGSTEFMISMLKKHLLFLPGGGKGLLSWIHVDDGARACADALERGPSGAVYNVVDDEPMSFGDVASALAETLGLPGPKSIPAALVKPVSSYAAAMAQTTLRVSNARIKRELGWQPSYPTVAEGISAFARDRTRAHS